LTAKLDKAKTLSKQLLVMTTKHKDAKKRIKRLLAKNKKLKGAKKKCKKCKKHGNPQMQDVQEV